MRSLLGSWRDSTWMSRVLWCRYCLQTVSFARPNGNKPDVFATELLNVTLSPWTEFASDWTSRCVADGEGSATYIHVQTDADMCDTVDWELYAQVLLALTRLINSLSLRFTSRLKGDVRVEIVPPLTVAGPKTSEYVWGPLISRGFSHTYHQVIL